MTTQCYWPNGSNATTNYTPCPGTSVCCASGEACLSNGLCYGAKLNIAYRGACTDPQWPYHECPDICVEEIPGLWANLYPCPNNTNQVFTCGAPGWASDVCEQQLGVITWPSGSVSVGSLTTSAPATSSITSSLSLTSPNVALSTPTDEPASSSSSSSPSSSPSSSSLSSQQVVLGTALGVGLGIPFLALTACMLWFCVRSNRRMKDMQAQNDKLQQENSRILDGRRIAYKLNELAAFDYSGAGKWEGPKPLRMELEG